MNNFIWLLRENPFSGARPFSCECVVPPESKPDDPALLAGSDLWIGVRRNGQSGLAARLRVAEVSEYEEGMHARHLLVSGDAPRSLWISAEANGFPAPRLSSMPADVVTGMSGEIADDLRGLLGEGARVSPIRHSSSILRRIPTPMGALKAARRVSAQLALTRKSVPYEDIHRWNGHRPELSPHASVALSKIAEAFPEILDAAAGVLVSLEAEKRAEAEWFDRVDDDFRDIDPEKIFSRKFIVRDADMSGFSMEKTENAEKRHQRILREVASCLCRLGLRPMESRSIDLAVETDAGFFVAEIKSATRGNFLSQGSGGIFQAVSYAVAMRNAGRERVAEMLIIEGNGADGDIRRLFQVGERCGVRIFLYKEDREWPGRVEGLADFLSGGSE